MTLLVLLEINESNYEIPASARMTKVGMIPQTVRDFYFMSKHKIPYRVRDDEINCENDEYQIPASAGMTIQRDTHLGVGDDELPDPRIREDDNFMFILW